jgi:hypothetical protein
VTELRDLIATVGDERYRHGCEWAWATAAGTGRSGAEDSDAQWPSDVVDVPHDLSDPIWDEGEASWLERVALAFELYREMPCYATLMYMRHYFREWDESASQRFWDEYRSLLSDQDDRLADPVAYSLWCDYFEDPASVEEAWTAVAAPAAVSERGLRRVLDVSGPVPYDLKVPVYERLLGGRHWHPFIFRSLLYSAFDVYGQIDAKAARKLLDKLALSKTTEGLNELREKLDAEGTPAIRRKKKHKRTDRRAPRRS